MSSRQICTIMKKSIKEHYKDAKIIEIPVADGGEGSVDCFLSAIGGEKQFVFCNNPYFEKMSAYYGLIDKNTAIIEMATCAGLPLVENRKNPALTTTYGVGELMLDAKNKGVKKIILGLGGSCTNDFGCGLASCCGVKFLDENGKAFIPVGQTLKDVRDIDISQAKRDFKGVEIIVMCDIDNVAYGINGASFVFAPQKGADADMIKMLDDGIKNICKVVKEKLNIEVKDIKGGGAAGAMGAGMLAFFGAKLKMGIEVVLDLVDFDKIISDADLIFTGEGKIDSQSLNGKVVIGVSKRAKKQGIPVIAVVGGAEGDLSKAYDMGVSAIFSINRLPQDFSISRNYSEQNLKFSMDNILRLTTVGN